MTDSVRDMADKMGVDYFNRKLQEEVMLFSSSLDAAKKDLSKNDLANMLKFLVAYPDTKGKKLDEKLAPIIHHATNAKDTFVALTVQILMEEGQRQSVNSQPKFKGEENG